MDNINLNPGKPIMVVDDSWVIRQFIIKILREKNYSNFVEAVDGIDALNKIEIEKPACLLLDLLMPRMNGFDLKTILNEKKIDVPTIFLTADIQDATRKKSIELGAIGYVNKPPIEDELLLLIQKALNI